MRKLVHNTLFVAMALAATSAFAAGAGNDSAASKPIPIGVDIELSGGAAVQGQAYSCAVKLVAKQVNKTGILGGRHIQLIIRDNRSDPTTSLQVAKQLVTNKHVVALVGGGSTPTTMSLVKYVDTVGLPTVSMGSATAVVEPVEERQYVFKTPATTDQVLAVMMKDFGRTGVHSIALLAVDNPYGEAGIKAVTAAAKADKFKLTGVEKFAGSDRDLTAQVTNLVKGHPDAIVVWAIPPGSGVAARYINYSGFKGKVYFDAGAGAELFLKGAGSTANGDLVISPPVLVAPQVKTAPNLKVMQSFYTAYSKQCGTFSGFASYAADALHMIVNAIKAANSTSGPAMRDALEHLHYTGITGVYQTSPTNHGGLQDGSLAVVTVANRQWKLVTQ